jgi:protein involved in polysaccharide export with SLBB domain
MNAANPSKLASDRTLALNNFGRPQWRLAQLIALMLLCPLSGGGVAAGQVPQPTDTVVTAPQQLPITTQAEILERIRQSGMTRSQMRARLQQMGYDPGLIDPYFNAIESGGRLPSGEPTDELLAALERLGLPVRTSRMDTTGLSPLELDSIARADSLAADSARMDSGTLRVFGSQLFQLNRTEFEAPRFGPVGPNYRLGPGDEVQLVLTGDVQAAHTLMVTREGMLFIPNVGQLSVNGLTLVQLEDRLYERLASVYSGVSRGAGATTRFSVSIGTLRANQVYLIGDVNRPGSYDVSSVATVFNALYLAHGPTDRGSYRNIEVRRGGELVRVVDLYDYLIRGDASDDVRLENGDRVFVPPALTQVAIDGAVRRRAIYEMREGEGLRHLLLFAGGPAANALLRRIQIERILPPSQRTPGRTRVIVDVDVATLEAGGDAAVYDGDIVHVLTVPDETRNRLWITGAIRSPGLMEWRPGITLWQAIDRADGLSETAYRARAQVYRLDESDRTRSLLQIPLMIGPDGAPQRDLALADGDSIVVLDRAELLNPEIVAIDGFVKEPGVFDLAEGMTLRDLVLAAGGFTHGAYMLEAEIAREPAGMERSDTVAVVYRAPLDAPAGTNGAPSSWEPAADEIVLQHGDRVFIRKAPGYESTRQVVLTGEVMLPGRYVLRTREERIADLLARAGGLTSEAYPDGMNVSRRGVTVGAELAEALTQPRGRNNIVLEAGDSVHVPAFDPTVAVKGAVAFEARVLHRPGASMAYYIAQAGGYMDNADKGRTTVTYANGQRATVRSYLGIKDTPDVAPGATINVPAEPETDGRSWDEIFTRVLTISSTLVTLLIGINQIN